ncbi:MAG: GNAT family N-acetyltransferase, partial [Desulfobulbales bacterium]
PFPPVRPDLSGLRRLAEKSCDMKRLYVRSQFRGLGLGRKLALEIITLAGESGYRRMYLDTLKGMDFATPLYRTLGFQQTDAYYANPLEEAVYLKLELTNAKENNF